MSKVLKSEEIVITRSESHFDRACDAANRRAVMIMGIDDCGHSKKIKGWERSCCSIRVTFKEYQSSSGMGGIEHNYTFLAEAVKFEEDDDED